MEKKYSKIFKYLKKYAPNLKEYEQFFLDIHGISNFHYEIENLLLEHNLENIYVFFGKVLINITKFDFDNIGASIKVKENFFPLKTEEDLRFFKENFIKKNSTKYIDEEIIKNILEKTKRNFDSFFENENFPFKKDHFTSLFNPFNSKECLELIKNFEEILKPFFSKINKENHSKITNNASLLKEILGLNHNKKGALKTFSEKGDNKWKTNLDYLGLSILKK